MNHVGATETVQSVIRQATDEAAPTTPQVCTEFDVLTCRSVHLVMIAFMSALSIDGMKIMSRLVLNKHTGSLIGFVDLGSANHTYWQ